MRRNLYSCIMLLLCLPLVVAWADISTENDNLPRLIFDTPPVVEWQGDSLRVSFTGHVEGRLRGGMSIGLLPFCVADKDIVRYPELVCATPKEARYRERRNALRAMERAGRKETVPAKRIQRISYGASDVESTPEGSVVYSETLPVPSSMRRKGAKLWMLPVVESCCERKIRPGSLVAMVEAAEKPQAEPIPATKEERIIVTPEQPVRIDIRVDYPVDSWEVLPGFGDNNAELARLDSLLGRVAAEDSTALFGLELELTGYASPEGTYEHNLLLSDRRAHGMYDYLISRYPLLRKLPARVAGVGEDWKSVRQYAELDSLPGAADVIHIIDRYRPLEGRERRLMDLRGGAPYRALRSQLFPRLRRVELVLRVRTGDAASTGKATTGKEVRP